MASKYEVKTYLAYWFQLGKKVLTVNGAATLRPHRVIVGDRYSDEFEECWLKIVSAGEHYYLEGTRETVAELLSPTWEIMDCVRCSMPVPIRSAGMPSESCPCNDISDWPNTELPPPRSPVNTQEKLIGIRDRLWGNLRSTNAPQQNS